MPLVFNGTTIPTNVANALMYNGTSVTQVIFNGTTVWQQNLFNAIWSGSSTCSGYGTNGLNTSSNLVRAVAGSNYGAWVSVDSNANFSGSSRGLVSDHADFSFSGSGHVVAGLTFDINTKSFTGSFAQAIGAVEGVYYNRIQTSGGLAQYYMTGRWNSSGAWISLT